jgi:hypothetical protein
MTGITASIFEEIAAELERAAEHALRAAEHYRNGDVPRGSAHAWAAQGHARNAQQKLDEQAREHAGRSQP